MRPQPKTPIASRDGTPRPRQATKLPRQAAADPYLAAIQRELNAATWKVG